MRWRHTFALFAVIGLSPEILGGSLEVTVKDVKGVLVPDAVVYATGGAGRSAARKQTVIDQRDKQFIPYVTALQVGTSVLFPNSDNVRPPGCA